MLLKWRLKLREDRRIPQVLPQVLPSWKVAKPVSISTFPVHAILKPWFFLGGCLSHNYHFRRLWEVPCYLSFCVLDSKINVLLYCSYIPMVLSFPVASSENNELDMLIQALSLSLSCASKWDESMLRLPEDIRKLCPFIWTVPQRKWFLWQHLWFGAGKWIKWET